MIIIKKGVGIAAAAPYQGPGDIVSGAEAWWGLRGYSLAYATPGTNNAVHIVDSGGANGTDIKILSTGGLDLGAVNTFITNHGTPSVATFYDQSGHGHDLTQSTVAQMPTLAASGNGLTSLPSMAFVSANSTSMSFTWGGVTQSAPFTFNLVGNHTTSAVTQAPLSGSGGVFAVYHDTANNQFGGYAGSNADATASDGNWHALGLAFTNSTADIIAVDAAQSTGTSMGGNMITNSTLVIMSDTSHLLDGFISEAGWWLSPGLSGANLTSLYNQQHTYYGGVF